MALSCSRTSSAFSLTAEAAPSHPFSSSRRRYSRTSSGRVLRNDRASSIHSRRLASSASAPRCVCSDSRYASQPTSAIQNRTAGARARTTFHQGNETDSAIRFDRVDQSLNQHPAALAARVDEEFRLPADPPALQELRPDDHHVLALPGSPLPVRGEEGFLPGAQLSG